VNSNTGFVGLPQIFEKCDVVALGKVKPNALDIRRRVRLDLTLFQLPLKQYR